MTPSIYVVFRTAVLIFAGLLGVQSVWLLSSELLRTDLVHLPTSPAAAAEAATKRDRAALAAAIGGIRGQLWAESAFTHADLLFGNVEESAEVSRQLARARPSLERALRDSPAQPAAWLLRAGLGARYPSLDFNATEALKMSYYVGPSEDDLIPLRLRLAVKSRAITDADMLPLIRRDVRFLLARKQQTAITEAYNAAQPAAKRMIEQIVSDVDPSAAGSLRAQKPSVPD